MTDCYTLAQVCAEARISAPTLQRMFRNGTGPKRHRWDGRSFYVTPADLLAWLATRPN